MISQHELMEKAGTLEGLSFLQLSRLLEQPLPPNLFHAKGWIGQAVENFLGGQASSRPCPDFPDLKIELKTLPVDSQGRVMESTYVTHCQLNAKIETDWFSSVCFQKLQTVLWVPIEGDKVIPLAQRRIGKAILWSPDEQEMSALQEDWQIICDLIIQGKIEKITGSMGLFLHLRPKATNSRALTLAYSEESELIKTLPRGYYLRRIFTQQILEKHRICD